MKDESNECKKSRNFENAMSSCANLLASQVELDGLKTRNGLKVLLNFRRRNVAQLSRLPLGLTILIDESSANTFVELMSILERKEASKSKIKSS